MWTAAISLTVSEQENSILKRWIHSPSTPQGIVQRAQIILLAPEGVYKPERFVI